MPKVSIIVPAYNEEKFIANNLASLKAQSYRDFEIIVVNNNSTDDTEKIAMQHVDKVYLELKKGYHNAVNRGVKESKGEIITFCDADSIYPQDWLEKVMEEFDSDPEIVAVYGSIKFYDHNFLVNFMSEHAYTFFLKISKRLGFDNAIGFNFVMKKEAYVEVGGYDPKIYDSILTDIELGKRIQNIGKIKQSTNIKAFTSSRRFKGDGFLKTNWYFLDAWYRLNYGKEQKMSYNDYNKEYRDEKDRKLLSWLNEVKHVLITRKKDLLLKKYQGTKRLKNIKYIKRVKTTLDYVDKQRLYLKQRIKNIESKIRR